MSVFAKVDHRLYKKKALKRTICLATYDPEMGTSSQVSFGEIDNYWFVIQESQWLDWLLKYDQKCVIGVKTRQTLLTFNLFLILIRGVRLYVILRKSLNERSAVS
jgi:hypothetical protein